MGLASSQARLLSLTSRKHSIEYRAQFLQAQKMRLSNDSDAVYDKYVNALDATQLQTRIYDGSGKVHWVDGSLNNLLRYNASQNTTGKNYYVQNINDGKLYMPATIVSAYNAAVDDMFTFMDALGVTYTRDVHNEDYISWQNIVQSDINRGWNNQPYSDEITSQYLALRAKVENPDESNIYSVASDISQLAYGYQNTAKTIYLPNSKNQYQDLKNNLSVLQGTPYYSGAAKNIIDYCNSFNVNAIFDNPTNVSTLKAHSDNGNALYLSYDASIEATEPENERQSVGDIFKLRLLLNGGDYNLNGGSDQDVYDASSQSTINSYVGVSSVNSNIGDALKRLSLDIMTAEYEKSLQQAKNNLNTYLNDNGIGTQEAVENKLANYDTYRNHVIQFESQSKETHTEYDNEQLGKYYEEVFSSIKSAGGCVEISETNAKNGNWVNNMIKNGQVILATFNNNSNELDNVTASSNTGIREVSNDDYITIADSEYETALKSINSKDSKFSIELNQLEEEHNAIQTEMDSLKKIAKENIEATFKTFT